MLKFQTSLGSFLVELATADAPITCQNFLDYAEEHVMLEAIVSTYADAVESEIGASMHEERVLAQRENPDYHGHFATNIRYLMDFVLGLCLAPSNEDLKDIPIKLWVRYMPDYPDVLMRRLLCEQLEFACDAEEAPALGAQ